jgi:hypothetical protein
MSYRNIEEVEYTELGHRLDMGWGIKREVSQMTPRWWLGYS